MTAVRIPPVLRAQTGGEQEVEVEGETVRDVLDDLVERFPELADRLFSDGTLARFVNVYVDSEDVRTLQGMETPVSDDSTVILLPAVAGGYHRSGGDGARRLPRRARGEAARRFDWRAREESGAVPRRGCSESHARRLIPRLS